MYVDVLYVLCKVKGMMVDVVCDVVFDLFCYVNLMVWFGDVDGLVVGVVYVMVDVVCVVI